MKKNKIIIGIIFCILAILLVVATSLICSLYYEISTINALTKTILIHVFIGLIPIFIIIGAFLISIGIDMKE